MSSSVLTRLQRGLETLYRVDTQLDVHAFLVSETERDQSLGDGDRHPREQLLLAEDHDKLSLALFLDQAAVENLERNDPARGLTEGNFADFCLAVEGVSHFIYVALRAAHDRPVSALELELQAEVDKFVSCLLLHQVVGDQVSLLRSRLFNDISFAADLGEEEQSRYHVANDEARRYTGWLHRRYIDRGQMGDMLDELRRFYRWGIGDKLGHIARAS